ncbi:MAG: PspA/IM30 family protein [Thermosynechococcaceae cyanobacterium]
MGLFDRIGRVIKSNVNAAVSAAEDPEKILEQTVVDMQENLVKLRQGVAGAIASQKRLEQQYNQAQTQADEWYRRAQLALQKGDENLAREALSRKQTFAETATSLKQQLDSSVGQVNTMKRGMTDLEGKIAKYKTEKDMLQARAKAAKATENLTQVIGQMDTSSATGAFDRMKDKVLQMEAKSAAMAELSGDSLESQFAALEAGGDVETELQLLKAQLDAPRIAGTPQGQEALPAGKEAVVHGELVDAELEEMRAKLNQPPA